MTTAPAVEARVLGLLATTTVLYAIGRSAFARAERTMRVRGTLGRY